jgi:hypothetical protein
MIFRFVLFVFCSLLFGCSAPETSISKNNPPQLVISASNDSLYSQPRTPEDIVVGFYKWYLANDQKVNAINFFKEVKINDTLTAYRIDFDSLNRRFDILLSSGYLSEKYRVREFQFYRGIDSLWAAERQFAGDEPDGTDYDRITMNQDDTNISQIPNLKAQTVSLKGKKAVVRVFEGVPLNVSLENENGWKITAVDWAKY